MSSLFEIKITTLAFGGDGLSRLPDGRAVFVPYVLPDEVVRIHLIEQKRRYARGELVEIQEPSPLRIAARCPHFTVCGGCHYQHMPYEEQLRLKGGVLSDQLKRIGGISQPHVLAPIAAPQSWNYRNHIQFHLTAKGQLGFRMTHSEEVLAIDECRLPELPIDQLWPRLEFEPLDELDRIGIRLGLDGDLQLILESDQPDAPEISVEGLDLSVVHLSPFGSLVLAGSQQVWMAVLGRTFRVSAGSFFQVNTPMAARMVEYVLAELSLNPASTVLDIFCGVGLFSAFFAQSAKRVVAIEANPYACEDFVVNLDEFDNVVLYEANVEEVLPTREFDADLILVDPPRSGLSRPALEGILAQNASRLVYVSCDPATLARDATYLRQGGYRLTSITPFDLFPQTYHIESISFWERN